ncbi:MAG: hypothetical protein SVZ03_00650 [Spirochaetota bacterium]|nr:hypothetical protein [Spirochaetota bacterium]
MIFNLSSRIIINILFPDINKLFQRQYANPRIAFSPIMNHHNIEYSITSSIKIRDEGKSFTIYVLTDNFSPNAIKLLNEHIESKLYEIEIVLNILFKNKYKIGMLLQELNANDQYREAYKRIDLSIIAKDIERCISIIIPVKFFRLFSRRIKCDSDSELIEREIIDFFLNPINILPNLKSILDTFNDIELQRLLFQLQNKKLITTYQICLINLSFPNHSLRIKRNLSTNTISDVKTMMKRLRSSNLINKRDLVEGIYSIEEAIYMLLKGDEDFSYSKFLQETQRRLKILSNAKILYSKDLYHWIEVMRDSKLLYQTISMTKEIDIVQSISEKPDLYANILQGSISKRRMEEIVSLAKNKSISFSERIYSQSNFVSTYRRLQIRRMNHGYKSFNYILSKIVEPKDFNHLILGVGWFILSTALKKTKKRNMLPLLKSIPLPARYLIEDIHQGIVNPNIIHDEIQINRAREICVKEIISLHQDGIIHLSD